MTNYVKNAEDYLTCETHPEFIETVKSALSDQSKLSELFGTRLSFGTAGIRGPIAPGYSGVNPGIILQTAQGYCSYLIETLSLTTLQQRGIIIGYDARKFSRNFAEITASVFISKRIKVFMFSQIIPTPFVSFSIRELKTAGGVMVTASHNPATIMVTKFIGKMVLKLLNLMIWVLKTLFKKTLPNGLNMI